MKKKYLLTTSDDKCVIIAEVDHKHKAEQNEFFVSQSFLDVNLKSKKFTDITETAGWDGRVWALTHDIM